MHDEGKLVKLITLPVSRFRVADCGREETDQASARRKKIGEVAG